MPTVFAAIVPHAPLILPAVAKEHGHMLAKTRESLEHLAEDLYAAKPDLAIILTPHGPQGPVAIGQVHDTLAGDLRQFGDIQTGVTVHGAPRDAQDLKEMAERRGSALMLQSDGGLDYGSVVPLTFLTANDPNIKILPIRVGQQDRAWLLKFGAALYHYTQESTQRIALIASGDLSHRPAESHQAASKPTADERLLSAAITANDVAAVAGLESQEQMCGYGPILVLLSALHGINMTGTIVSFEAPFSVGQLTATLIPRS